MLSCEPRTVNQKQRKYYRITPASVPAGRQPADPGMVYRHLRKLEQEGFVSSSWDTSGTGPARRNYRITKEGGELLRSWIPFMERNLRSLEKFLAVFRQGTAKKGGK